MAGSTVMVRVGAGARQAGDAWLRTGSLTPAGLVFPRGAGIGANFGPKVRGLTGAGVLVTFGCAAREIDGKCSWLFGIKPFDACWVGVQMSSVHVSGGQACTLKISSSLDPM